MEKKEAIKIILECAQKYKKDLENRNILFIYRDKSKKLYEFEAEFEAKHFHHFTGTIFNKQLIKSSKQFYEMCLRNNLSANAFEMNEDGTAELKLKVLPSLIQIHKASRMVGEYDHSKPLLRTEKLSGGIVGCMGFVKDGCFYVPNTILKEDIRDITSETLQVVATFRKKITDKQYTEITYTAKGINFETLEMPESIRNKIEVELIKSLNTK